MKIVDLKAFRSMTNGTVYSKYEPNCFDGLKIKTDTWEHDFVYQDLIGNLEDEGSEDFSDKCDLAENGESIKLDFHYTGRDGLFDKDQLFAVYEKDDLDNLIARLRQAREYHE